MSEGWVCNKLLLGWWVHACQGASTCDSSSLEKKGAAECSGVRLVCACDAQLCACVACVCARACSVHKGRWHGLSEWVVTHRLADRVALAEAPLDQLIALCGCIRAQQSLVCQPGTRSPAHHTA